MGFKLFSHQEKALKTMKSGSILNGGVGSGKTLTSLIFYKLHFSDRPLYVITTAKKRDTGDWEEDAAKAGVTIDAVASWNVVNQYLQLKDAFVIFDEQRAIGYSTWGRSFIKIAKNNKWLMLTATPGDTWMDYMTVFIANGWYRNKTDFTEQHVEYDPWVSFPKIKKFHNEGKLQRYRRQILVPMHFKRSTVRMRQMIFSEYNNKDYNTIKDNRWNVFEDKPIENASEMMHSLRRVVAIDEDRKLHARFIIDIHPKLIIFYNYNYELDAIIESCDRVGREYWQWNGHVHDELPNTDEWVYIVQYTSGAEGWNCVTSNVMLFYSLNYSYKMMEQAEGRIDRINTDFKQLEYYILMTNSRIERDIERAVKNKQAFNESAWVRGNTKLN